MPKATDPRSTIHDPRSTIHDPTKVKTSGWTEATRNLFHPGAIMTVIGQYAGFAPSSNIEAIEFVCHYLGEGREFPQPNITDDGVIYGYMFNFVPRLLGIRDQVREQFPELTKYTDELIASPDFEKRFETEESRFALIALIEARFGKTIKVLPQNSKALGEEKVVASQAELLAQLAARGTTIIGVAVPSRSAGAGAGAPTATDSARYSM